MTSYQIFSRHIRSGRLEYIGEWADRALAGVVRNAFDTRRTVGVIRPIERHGSIADLDEVKAA